MDNYKLSFVYAQLKVYEMDVYFKVCLFHKFLVVYKQEIIYKTDMKMYGFILVFYLVRVYNSI